MDEQDKMVVQIMRTAVNSLTAHCKLKDIDEVECVFIAQYGSDCKVATAGTAHSSTIVNCLASFLASMHQAGELDYKKILKLISADIERRLSTGKIRAFNEKDN